MLTILTETDGTTIARRRKAKTPAEILDVRRARLAKLTRMPSTQSLRAMARDLVVATKCSYAELAQLLAEALQLDDCGDAVRRPQQRLLLVLVELARSEKRGASC